MFAGFKFDFEKMFFLIFDMCVCLLFLFSAVINLPKMNLTNLDVFILTLMCVATLYFMLRIVRLFFYKYIFENRKDK
ncbi:hypothetical protein CN264_10290 [Bacillus cereus]|nr:hypothetical protein CN264_10290 [Bacillus cereus]